MGSFRTREEHDSTIVRCAGIEVSQFILREEKTASKFSLVHRLDPLIPKTQRIVDVAETYKDQPGLEVFRQATTNPLLEGGDIG